MKDFYCHNNNLTRRLPGEHPEDTRVITGFNFYNMARQEIEIPNDWKEKLKEMADAKSGSVSQLIRDALYEAYFKTSKNS